MLSIRSLLTGKKTSDDYRRSMAEAREEIKTVTAALADQRSRRQGLLLSDDDAALEALDASIAKSGRQLERLNAVVADLEPRLAQSAREEELADQARRVKAAEVAQSESVELLDIQYRTLCERARDVLARVEECRGVMKDARENGAKVGMPCRFDPPEKILAERAGRKHWTEVGPGMHLPNPDGGVPIFDRRPQYMASLGGGVISVAR